MGANWLGSHPKPMNQEEQRIKVYRCPKDCSVGDTSERCKRCGEWKLYQGEMTQEEINQYNEQLTRAAY